MAISRRLRYEVLRRDGHACRYCGSAAPEVQLTVDHVVPVALGGADDPSNLVAACRPCNAGKTSSSPDSEMVAEVSERSLLWAQAMRQAARDMVDDLNARQERREQFRVKWDRVVGARREPLPHDWQTSVDRFVAAGLPLEVLLDCVDAAAEATYVRRNLFRYMCGVAWKRIKELQDATERVVNGPPSESGGSDFPFPTVDACDWILNYVLHAVTEDQRIQRLASDALWSCLPEGDRAFHAALRADPHDYDTAFDAAEISVGQAVTKYGPRLRDLAGRPAQGGEE